MRPLHQRDPLTRFSGRAQSYALYRPTYPPEAIEAVLEGLGEAGTLRVADIGAGTGIAARLMAQRGALVRAVEPNAEMRNATQEHPRVTYVDGSAEHTGLPSASVDVVTAFQAYHWFDPEPAHHEFARILVPGGRVALVWNVRDDSDPFTAAYGELIRAIAIDRQAEGRHGAVDPFKTSSLFTGVRMRVARLCQRLDLRALIGRADSMSYMPREGAAYARLVAELERLHGRFADSEGDVTLVYRTETTLGEI